MLIAHVQHFMHGRCGDRADEAAKGSQPGAPAPTSCASWSFTTRSVTRAQAIITDFAADGFHPNAVGYHLWADDF